MISIPPNRDIPPTLKLPGIRNSARCGITSRSFSMTIKFVGWLPKTPYQVDNGLENSCSTSIRICTSSFSFVSSFLLYSSTDESRVLGRVEVLYFRNSSFRNRCHTVVFPKNNYRTRPESSRTYSYHLMCLLHQK